MTRRLLNTSSRAGVYGMAPTVWSRTLTVNATGPNNPGMGQFQTINAAMSNAAANTAARALGPMQWQRILVSPNSYPERIQAVPYVALIGTGNGPADTVVAGNENTPGQGLRAVFVSEGNNFYVSNITFHYTGTNEFWHPLREGGYGNYAEPRLVFFEDVIFRSQDNAMVDSIPADLYCGSNTMYLFHRVTFVGRNVPACVIVVTGADSGPVPGKMFFLNCHVEGNKLTWRQNAEVVYDLSTLDANLIGVVEISASLRAQPARQDIVVWANGTFDIGTATGTPGQSKPYSSQYWFQAGGTVPTTKVYSDSSVTKYLELGTAIGMGHRTIPDLTPYLPVNGVTPDARAWYLSR